MQKLYDRRQAALERYIVSHLNSKSACSKKAMRLQKKMTMLRPVQTIQFTGSTCLVYPTTRVPPLGSLGRALYQLCVYVYVCVCSVTHRNMS